MTDTVGIIYDPRAEWESECMKWRGRVLVGEKRHYCFDWDELPVDETTEEFDSCHCFDEDD